MNEDNDISQPGDICEGTEIGRPAGTWWLLGADLQWHQIEDEELVREMNEARRR